MYIKLHTCRKEKRHCKKQKRKDRPGHTARTNGVTLDRDEDEPVYSLAVAKMFKALKTVLFPVSLFFVMAETLFHSVLGNLLSTCTHGGQVSTA